MNPEKGERIYPKSSIACVVVWILDRFPHNIRTQILDSYWSESDIELAKIRAKELWHELNLDVQDK